MFLITEEIWNEKEQNPDLIGSNDYRGALTEHIVRPPCDYEGSALLITDIPAVFGAANLGLVFSCIRINTNIIPKQA